jgi:hypothetical protein
MELSIPFGTDDQGQVYAQIGVPCKGYFTDWILHVYANDDVGFITIGKNVPQNELQYPQAADEEYFIPADNVTIDLQAINGQHGYHRGYSNRKVSVSQGDMLKLAGYKDNTNYMTGFIQATFVPEVGQIITQRKRIDLSSGQDLTSEQVMEILTNGRIEAIRSTVYSDESASGEYIMSIRVFKIDKTDKDIASSFSLEFGDSWDVNSQSFAADNFASNMQIYQTDISSAFANNVVKDGKYFGDRKCQVRDRLKIDTVVVDGTIPDDKLYLDLEVDIRVNADNDNEHMVEYMEYGPQGIVEEILLLGDLDLADK